MENEKLQELITGCIHNKRAYQEKLYKTFSHTMYALCKRYSTNSEAEDILQEGFITIFNKISSFKSEGSFEGWMKRIFINLALQRYKKNKRLQLVEDDFVFDKSEDPEVYSLLSCNELYELIDELPPQYKLVFNLYVIDGFSHKEIAQKLDISEGTSKSNLSRARKIMMEKVGKMSWINKNYN